MSVHHERILSSMLRSLEPGCPIVTADGEQIGTLSEITDEAIKVDAPMRRDFWIDADYVRSCEGGRIELSFIKSDLGAYKTSQATRVGAAPGTMREPAAADDALDHRVDVSRQAGISFPSVAENETEPAIAQPRPVGDPLVQGKADHIISDEEQVETRLRMERELAAQRQALPHLHPRGDDGPPDTFGTIGEPVESELSRYGIDPRDGSYAHGDGQTRVLHGKFLAVAAAVIPFIAVAWWLRRRR